jgi:hypothetical protein
VQRFRGGLRALRLMRNPEAGGVGAARSRSFCFFLFSRMDAGDVMLLMVLEGSHGRVGRIGRLQ